MQFAPKENHDGYPSVDESLLHSEQQSLEQPGSHARPTDETVSHKHSQSRWSSIPWKLEVISWIGSLCFFIAIIVVLRIVDDRPSPNLQFGITPNSIVSLLATFAEALMIVPVNAAIGQTKWLEAFQEKPIDHFRTIDEASRGPIGSIFLLAGRKGGLVASFGAVITIVALGISTFTQQTLKYHTIYPHSDNALIPIAQYMNGTGSAPISNGGATNGVDSELLPAPYLAIYSPAHTNFTPTTYCGTGNCTWEPYQTLGVCNTCANLTSTLKMTKVHVDASEHNLDVAYNTDYYTLSNGFGLSGNQPVDAIVSTSLMNITTDWTGDWTSIAFANNGSKLLSIFVVGSSPGTIPRQPDADSSADPMTGILFATPVAFECMLQLCIRDMRADFINGTLTETEISRWTNQSQPLRDNGHFILQPPKSSTTFVATDVAIEGTSDWLSNLLIGNAIKDLGGGNWDVSTSPDTTSELTRQIYMAMNSSSTGFPDLMENLANSLSLNLRKISYQPARNPGKAFYPTSHAVVTWEWLALPLLELLGTLIFLVAVMVETRKRCLVPWTNSVLAFFFHGLDERPTERHVRENQDSMKKDASKLVVEFQPHRHGGSLVVVKHNGVSR